jgi:hypothetical protein
MYKHSDSHIISIQESNVSPYQKISSEILLHIFSFIGDTNDFISLVRVSQSWRKAASSERFWERIVRYDKSMRSIHFNYFTNFFQQKKKFAIQRQEKAILKELNRDGLKVDKIHGYLSTPFGAVIATSIFAFIYVVLATPYALEYNIWNSTAISVLNHILMVPYIVTLFIIAKHELLYIRILRKTHTSHKHLFLDRLSRQYFKLSNFGWILFISLGILYNMPISRWLPLYIYTLVCIIYHWKHCGHKPWYSYSGLVITITASLQVSLISMKENEMLPEYMSSWGLVLWPTVLCALMSPLCILLRKTTTDYIAEMVLIVAGFIVALNISVTVLLVAFKFDFEWSSDISSMFIPVISIVCVSLLLGCVCTVFLLLLFDSVDDCCITSLKCFSEEGIDDEYFAESWENSWLQRLVNMWNG